MLYPATAQVDNSEARWAAVLKLWPIQGREVDEDPDPDGDLSPEPDNPVQWPAGIPGTATHYGESYNGQPLGCAGAGVYDSDDPTIVAVGPARYMDWQCGQRLVVCARHEAWRNRVVSGDEGLRSSPDLLPEVRCILAVRVDSCPGCGANHIDLSERGIAIVCGAGAGRCDVLIYALE